jgi:hypothetical protein
VSDPIDHLRDQIARQDEHSHVDPATRERIRTIISEGDEQETLTATARRVASALTTGECAEVVADWLEGQTAI